MEGETGAALSRSPGSSPIRYDRAQSRPTIWFEVESLLRHFDWHARPSGIERVCIELFSAAQAQRRYRVAFCRIGGIGGRLRRVDFAALRSAWTDKDRPWFARGTQPRAHWRATRFLPHLQRFCRRAGAALIHDLTHGRRDRIAFERSVAEGDVLVCLGGAWRNPRYGAAAAAAKRKFGIGFAVLIHDIIPISEPQFVPRRHAVAFRHWFEDVAASADLIVTSSRHCRAELETWYAEHVRPAPCIETVPFGCGISGEVDADRSAAPRLPPNFVLFVSSIERRKNHLLLVRVWQRMVIRHGQAAVPPLVLLGGINWLAGNVLAELAATRYLDGKIVHLTAASDAAVREAYRRCMFTVFPSLSEGWGLPVAESLAHGKFCVASNRCSLPEVGADFVDYFDPTDEEEAQAKIERVIFDPAYLAARTAHIKAEYISPSWAECADRLLALCAALSVPVGHP